MQHLARPQPLLRLTAASLLGTLLLVGCGATTNSSTDSTTTSTAAVDPITFQTTTMPVAYMGENFSSNIAVLGGVGPYGYRIVAGSLPPGIKLSGTSLTGTPTTAGAYQFTVEASDANLSTRVKQYTLNVNDLPPLSLEPELPTSQVRGETRIPIRIKAARKVRAARLVWDLGKDVKLARVQATDPINTLFWSQEGQLAIVDIGFKTIPRSDTRVLLLTVVPGQPTTLSSTNFWYESRDGQGKLLSGKQRPLPPAVTPDGVDSKTSATPATNTNPPVPGKPGPGNPTPANPGSANKPAPLPGTGQSPAPASSTSGGTPMPAPYLPAPYLPAPGQPTTPTSGSSTPAPTAPNAPVPNPNNGGVVK